MPHVKEAFKFLEENVDLFRSLACDPKKMLYVGVRHDMRPWWYRTFGTQLGIESFGVIEIFPKNIADFEVKVWSGEYENVNHVICGDVTELHQIIQPGEYDVIFWDHGPEHVDEDTLRKATMMITACKPKLLLYCGPWGPWPQGPEDGNEHEEHKVVLNPELMRSIGMDETVTFNGYGQANEGELVSWWVNRNG